MDSMNAWHLFTGLRSLTLVAATGLALTGCMTREEEDPGDYASDGQSAFLVGEMDQMGQTLGQLSEGGLAKTAEAGDFVIRGELVIDPWAYQAGCQCFVRRAEYTGERGFERLRLDSVTFLDSAGSALDSFRPARIAKALYRRNVTKSKDGRQVDVRIDVVVDMKRDGDLRVGVWNGTMSGSFNGQEFKNGSITEVVRPFVDGRFRFPESGILEINRPVFRFKVEFLGDGRAKVTIRNKVNDRIHVLWVDKDYNETPAAEE
jgi:hypothetical protein